MRAKNLYLAHPNKAARKLCSQFLLLSCFLLLACSSTSEETKEKLENKPQDNQLLFTTKQTLISHPYFKLTVPSNWKEEKPTEPERHNFLDKKRKLALTISYMDFPIPPEKVREAAEFLAKSRTDGHLQFKAETNGEDVYFAGPDIHPKDWGDQIVYQVTDKSSYVGSYVGFVAAGFNLNIYVQTENLDTNSLDDALHAILSEIVFSEVVWENVPARENSK